MAAQRVSEVTKTRRFQVMRRKRRPGPTGAPLRVRMFTGSEDSVPAYSIGVVPNFNPVFKRRTFGKSDPPKRSAFLLTPLT